MPFPDFGGRPRLVPLRSCKCGHHARDHRPWCVATLGGVACTCRGYDERNAPRPVHRHRWVLPDGAGDYPTDNDRVCADCGAVAGLVDLDER